MKSNHFTVFLFATLGATAVVPADLTNDINVGAFGNAKVSADQSLPLLAADPPPAPTPFPDSVDGMLDDGTIIHYTPNDPPHLDHSCWTKAKGRIPIPAPHTKGQCSLCVVQRKGLDHSADYLLWARDADNNAIGNMRPTAVWPVDGLDAPGNRVNASTPVGGDTLILQTARSGDDDPFPSVTLALVPQALDPQDPLVWGTQGVLSATFNSSSGSGCKPAGTATGGAVHYAICLFNC